MFVSLCVVDVKRTVDTGVVGWLTCSDSSTATGGSEPTPGPNSSSGTEDGFTRVETKNKCPTQEGSKPIIQTNQVLEIQEHSGPSRTNWLIFR